MRFILIFASLELSFAWGSAGPLSVWYGEPSIADVYSDSGYYSDDMKIEKMFDECGGTSWHSARGFERREKSMRVVFYV